MKEYGSCPKLKGEIIQHILSRKGGMYLVSATPPQWLIGRL
jgi:hypothetical protein